MLDTLFKQFIQEKQFLKNITPRTVEHFNGAWRSFRRYAPACSTPVELNKKLLNGYVTAMRESGLKAKSCNTYISGINSFLRWLKEEEHVADELRIKLLKVEKQVFKTTMKHSPRYSLIVQRISMSSGSWSCSRFSLTQASELMKHSNSTALILTSRTCS